MTLLTLAVAYLLASEVRFEFRVQADFRATALTTLPLVLALGYLVLRLFGVQRHSRRFTSLWDMVALGAALTVASLLLVTLRFALPPPAGWSRSPIPTCAGTS